jgi:hypothetical protein
VVEPSSRLTIEFLFSSKLELYLMEYGVSSLSGETNLDYLVSSYDCYLIFQCNQKYFPSYIVYFWSL